MKSLKFVTKNYYGYDIHIEYSGNIFPKDNEKVFVGFYRTGTDELIRRVYVFDLVVYNYLNQNNFVFFDYIQFLYETYFK